MSIFGFTEEQEQRLSKLVGIDHYFTEIWEKIKMRVPISPKQRDYFYEKLGLIPE